VRTISGRPLITWSIETAITSGVFDRVVVSTDDGEIATIAAEAGAEIPFVRPDALADDHATTGAVMAHAARELAAQGSGVESLCCMYPGALFVTGEDLAKAEELLRRPTPVAYVMAVARYPHPVQRALRVDGSGMAVPVSPEYVRARTQDLEPRWHDAGQFYWGTADAWIANLPVHGNARAYLMDSAPVVDIDSEDDWQMAECLHDRIVRRATGG
jgi:pseudaminic acid cytidylyltransferase